MFVYRICSKSEIDYILNNGNFDSIGGLGERYGSNNHKYQDGVYYMHFFLNKYSIIQHCFKKGMCICTYDIPIEVLSKYKGVGQYDDFGFNNKNYLDEFAIDIREMRVDYLRKVEVFLWEVKDSFITGCKEHNMIEIIYDASKPMARERKKEESSS